MNWNLQHRLWRIWLVRGNSQVAWQDEIISTHSLGRLRTTATARQSLASEGHVNEAARAHPLAAPTPTNTSEARLLGSQTLRGRHRASNNSSCANITNTGCTTSTSRSNTAYNSGKGFSEDPEVLQDALERSFSVFDVIYRSSLSQSNCSNAVSATETAQPTSSTMTEPKDIKRGISPTPALSVPFLSSKTPEGPAVLLSVLRDLTNARVRMPEAWAPPLLLLMQQLPLLSSSEVQKATALLAAAGCRPPLLLQGLCEAFSWRAAAKQTEASQTVLFLDSLRRISYHPPSLRRFPCLSLFTTFLIMSLYAFCIHPCVGVSCINFPPPAYCPFVVVAASAARFLNRLWVIRYLPCVSHLRLYFASLERRRKCLTAGDLLKIQRFVDELGIPTDLATLPFLVSVLPQLKRNASALKPPEAAALAGLLLKRQELDREIAECLSAAVYEHLGGTSSYLLLQQEPACSPAALHSSQEEGSDNMKRQYHQQMFERQRERLASPSSFSCLLHLGNSLAAANLKQMPPAFCWALEREVELHWASMTPVEVSATLNLLAKIKHRATSPLNKLGLAVQHSLHLYTPNLLSGCISSFDILHYRHSSLLSSLSAFILNKQITSTHDGKRSPDHVHQYPRPSPRFVGQLSAVSATMPTAAGTTAAPTATAASADAPHPRRGSAQQRQEQILSSGSAAEAQTTEPHALHGLQSLQRLPHDAHLPPPLASGRYTCEDKFNKTALIEAEVTPKHTPRCLAVSGGLLENEKCSKVISAQEVSAPTTSRRLTAISHAEDGTTAATLPVRSTGTPCGAGASIDPFLAATLLQHLSRTQHNKDPELLSRLLASVSAATANHGQQQRKLLHSEQNSSRLPDSSRVSVTADSASSGLDTSVESAVVVAGAEKEVVTTAANSSEASLGAAASAAFPAELSATEATVRNHRVFHVGTHELRESWATYAAAVVAAADALSPRWGSAKKRSHFGPVAKASRKQNPADHKPGKTRLRINTALSGGISKPAGFTVIPTDQDMIRRLKEQGFHRALMFVTLPWRAFVSQFRKVIDLGTQLPTSAGGNQLPRKSRGTGNSFVPAGAEVARTRTKGEARLAHLYRVWGFSGPPGLSRLRRRHLRRLVMKMSTAVSGTPHPLIEGSMAANVEGLCGKDRERAVGAAPGGRKRNILYGKCAADSMKRWACCRRAFLQPFQVASLLSRHSLPPIGVEVAASAVTDASGKGPSPRLTETALPEWQVQHQPAWHPKFPFGISFADTAGTQALLVDTGPLLPPVLPGDAPSSLTKQVKQQYDKKMRCAAQAKAFLQRHQHRRENLTTRIGSPSVGACTATSAEVANPATIPAPGQPSQSPQLSTLQAASVMCPRDSVPSAARRKLGLTAKEEQHRSRLLHAAAGALSAAASMRVLSLRIARPFVVQLPLLCGEYPRVAGHKLAAAKDLNACCTAAAAALQTLGLRLDEPLNHIHSARRRRPLPPTPDLARMREEVLISLEVAFRSPRFLTLWQQAAADAAPFEHVSTQHRPGDKPHERLTQLLAQATYLYSVVFQALVNDMQIESTPSALLTAWHQQQQSALQFCNILANVIATMGGLAIHPNYLPSFTFMLNASRCLLAGVISAPCAPEHQQSRQPLMMLLQRTERAILQKVEQALIERSAYSEEQLSKDTRLSLVALMRSYQSAHSQTTGTGAETGNPVHPLVNAFSNKMCLPENTVRRWVRESAAAEKLRLQRS